MSLPKNTLTQLGQLEAESGESWQHIQKAEKETKILRDQLDVDFAKLGSPDTSLVVFGSVARGEVTSGSDLDWILLIDGQSVPEHKDQEREVERKLISAGYADPGASGVFGRMVGSHDLVHHIG